MREVRLRGEARDLLGRVEGIEPRPFAGLEADAAAQRIRDYQNVREDDRGVETEAPDRLQRDLGGEFRREAEIEEAARLGAQFPVFRQIAPGLAHHPDRRHGLPLACEHVEERFG